jgi:hypothetical protein
VSNVENALLSLLRSPDQSENCVSSCVLNRYVPRVCACAYGSKCAGVYNQGRKRPWIAGVPYKRIAHWAMRFRVSILLHPGGHGSSDTCRDACTAQLAGTAPNFDAASAPVWRSSRRSTNPRSRSAQLRAFKIAERTITRGRSVLVIAQGAGVLREMGIRALTVVMTMRWSIEVDTRLDC